MTKATLTWEADYKKQQCMLSWISHSLQSGPLFRRSDYQDCRVIRKPKPYGKTTCRNSSQYNSWATHHIIQLQVPDTNKEVSRQCSNQGFGWHKTAIRGLCYVVSNLLLNKAYKYTKNACWGDLLYMNR